MNHLHHLSDNTVAEHVYNALCKLNLMDFDTWVTRVSDLTQYFCLDIDMAISEFKCVCKRTVINDFISTWNAEQNLNKTPILRFYDKIKHSFGIEKYSIGVKNDTFRTALTKLRSSSHTLDIETGRHSRPQLNVHECLCQVCHCIGDETHFMLNCHINSIERYHLFTRLKTVYPQFESLPNEEKCLLLLPSQDNQIMIWVGKFIYKSFVLRSETLNGFY